VKKSGAISATLITRLEPHDTFMAVCGTSFRVVRIYPRRIEPKVRHLSSPLTSPKLPWTPSSAGTPTLRQKLYQAPQEPPKHEPPESPQPHPEHHGGLLSPCPCSNI